MVLVALYLSRSQGAVGLDGASQEPTADLRDLRSIAAAIGTGGIGQWSDSVVLLRDGRLPRIVHSPHDGPGIAWLCDEAGFYSLTFALTDNLWPRPPRPEIVISYIGDDPAIRPRLCQDGPSDAELAVGHVLPLDAAAPRDAQQSLAELFARISSGAAA